MALPAKVLEQLPSGVRWARLGSAREPSSVLSLGFAELDGALPDGGLPRGAVVELAVWGGAALATSLVLAACREAQQQATHQGSETPWCAFIDPHVAGSEVAGGSLYAPAVQRAGVDSDRLLVVRPEPQALSRIALRVVESQAFAVVGIDTVGALGAEIHLSLASWHRVVRRLAAIARESSVVVLLITDAEARRPLPLPVAMRLEMARPASHRLSVEVAKERYGRVSGPHTVTWAKRRVAPLTGIKKVRSSRPPSGSSQDREADKNEQLFA
jgi:hypothetical protein